MTRDIVTVDPTLRLPRAWQIMREARVRHLPVVQRGALVGILSDRDVLLRARPTGDLESAAAALDGLDVEDVIVAVAMTPNPRTCQADAPVSAVARAMIDDKIDALPVLRGDRLAGLVTSTDLLWLLLEDDAQRLPFDFTLRAVTPPGTWAA